MPSRRNSKGGPLASIESYAALTAEQRLQTLYTVVELCTTDEEIAPETVARFRDLDIEVLRMTPIGSDAACNNYYYVGDAAHIFREPDPNPKKIALALAERAAAKARQRKEEEKLARLEERRIAAAERRALIEERKKIAAKKRAEKLAEKERRMKKREEERLARRAEWAPRAASARVTRASRAAEVAAARAATENASRVEEDKEAEDDTVAENAEDKGSHPNSEPEQSEEEKPPSAINSPEHRGLSSPVAKATTVEPSRATSGKSSVDETVRRCVKWELVCGSAGELKDFLDRFEDLTKIYSMNERALLGLLKNELLPVFEEAEKRVRKEREKRERSEWIAFHQKRSSRVREREARAAAEKSKEKKRTSDLRMEELHKKQRQNVISKLLEEYARAQIKELRMAKRDQLRHEESRKFYERGAKAKKNKSRGRGSLLGKRNIKASSRSLRSSKVGRRGSSVDDIDDGAKGQGDEESDSASLDGNSGKAGNVERHDALTRNGKKSKNEPTLAGNFEERLLTSKLTAASLEPAIPDELTLTTTDDDFLPTRALHHYIFINKLDCSEVPVEAVDDKDIPVVALGILAPPEGSEEDPLRVELHNLTEWAIEYGDDCRIWVKTEVAWYELICPHVDYRAAFSSTLRKYELCVRICLLGDTMSAKELSYEAVVNLLSERYKNMKKYKCSDIEAEYKFILSQVDDLKHDTLRQCGFIKVLRNWKDAEDRRIKAATSKKSPVKREMEMKKNPRKKSRDVSAAAEVASKSKRRRRSRGERSKRYEDVSDDVVSDSSTPPIRSPAKGSDDEKGGNSSETSSIDDGREVIDKAPNPSEASSSSEGEISSDESS